MCDEAACLHSKAEFRWCCFAPSFHAGFGREAIKTVVDFDCIEMADVPTEILLGRKLGGIEVSPPVTVMPAGSAYDHACGYRQPRSVHGLGKPTYVEFTLVSGRSEPRKMCTQKWIIR